MIVDFYDNGSPIVSFTVTETLAGGAETDVAVQWIVPSSTSPHDISIVLDPNGNPDDDPTNNTALLAGVMRPDVIVESVQVQQAGKGSYIFNSRVTNVGSLDITGVDLTLRMSGEDGPVLTVLNISETLVPGAFYDVSWQWDLPQAGSLKMLPVKEGKILFIADEANLIDEFDETNNIRSVTLWSHPMVPRTK